MKFVWNARLPRSIQESFTCCKSTTWGRRLYFPSEGRRAEDFFALKNPTASAGFESANLGTKGQHATSRPPKPHFFFLRLLRLSAVSFNQCSTLAFVYMLILPCHTEDASKPSRKWCTCSKSERIAHKNILFTLVVTKGLNLLFSIAVLTFGLCDGHVMLSAKQETRVSKVCFPYCHAGSQNSLWTHHDSETDVCVGRQWTLFQPYL